MQSKLSPVLITGGAGYIGSHVTKLFCQQKIPVIVLDNLYSGFRQAVPEGVELVEGNTGDITLVSELLKSRNIQSILHFAAHTVVPESVSDPLKYYNNNTENTLRLLQAAKASGVKQFVFSSTAAVYGETSTGIATETDPTTPINPYGMSKLMSEYMIKDYAASSDMDYVILRYFNVAGGDPEGQIGQTTANATHLIKVVCEALTGKREQISIFGTDYPTTDGTGVRDYIHVWDLANAHLAALKYLLGGGASTTLNCGYGTGFSVREVVEAAKAVSGLPLTAIEHPRRDGDSAQVIAACQKILNTLDWQPLYNQLDVIISHALQWERQQAKQPW